MSSISLVRFDHDGDVIMQAVPPPSLPMNLRSMVRTDFEGDVIMGGTNSSLPIHQRSAVQNASFVFNSILSSFFAQNWVQNLSADRQTLSSSLPARNSIPQAAIQKLSRLAQPTAHLRPPQQMPKSDPPKPNQNGLSSRAAAQSVSRQAPQTSFLRPPQRPRILSPIPVQNRLRSIQQTSQRILQTQSSFHSISTVLSASSKRDERDLFLHPISASQSGNYGMIRPGPMKLRPTISLPTISESPPRISRSISGNIYDNSNLDSEPESPPPFSDGDELGIVLEPPPNPKRTKGSN